MAEEKTPTPQERLAERQAQREQRKEERAAKRAEQELVDLDALEELEAEHGMGAISQTPIDYVEGLPTVVYARTPTTAEMARFRATIKPKRDGKSGDLAQAKADLADICLLYPERSVYDQMCDRFPSLKPLVGEACLVASSGRADAQAKF